MLSDHDEFERAYRLRPGQVLRRIKPPFLEGRLDFYRKASPSQANSLPNGPATMFLTWKNGELSERAWGMAFGKGLRNVEMLLEAVLNVFPQDVEGDVGLLNSEILGDFLFRQDAMEEEYLRALEEIAGDEFKCAFRLSLREVDAVVIILRGKWQYEPVDEIARGRKCIEHFGRELNTRREGNGGGSGDAKRWAKHLGRCINQQIIVEGEGVPERIRWCHNDRGDDTDESRRLAHDPQLVLSHIREQTELIPSFEARRVRRLLVERLSK